MVISTPKAAAAKHATAMVGLCASETVKMPQAASTNPAMPGSRRDHAAYPLRYRRSTRKPAAQLEHDPNRGQAQRDGCGRK
jgi:hypothetical protein